MAALRLDDVAWTSRWRHRAIAEKALLALGLLLVALLAQGPWTGLVVLLVSTAAACGGSGVPWRTWVRLLLAPASFVLLGVIGIAVTLHAPVAGAGQVVAAWGPVHVTQASLLAAAETATRAMAGTSAVLLLAASTPMPYLLGACGRVPGLAVLAELGGVVYRFLFGLLEAQARIRESQAARLGYGSTRRAYASLGVLTSATLVRAWTGARRLEEGLAGRAPAGVPLGAPRTDPVRRPAMLAAGLVVALVALTVPLTPGWPR